MALMRTFIPVWIALGAVAVSCAQPAAEPAPLMEENTEIRPISVEVPEGLAAATFGTGCFWCTEAVFERLRGVQSVVSGYSGGHVENPSYEEVCGKGTGHAEVRPHRVRSRDRQLCRVARGVSGRRHDPTTLNRQGNDVGPQYRSAIFYHDDEQRRIAAESRAAATESRLYPDPIVTEISPLINYYPAENYHQEYFENNPNQPYCSYVVAPKVEKFKQAFRDRLKDTP